MSSGDYFFFTVSFHNYFNNEQIIVFIFFKCLIRKIEYFVLELASSTHYFHKKEISLLEQKYYGNSIFVGTEASFNNLLSARKTEKF
jgi:hypothetical protein